MSRARFVIASFAAPIAALLLPALLALSEIYAEPAVLPSGEFDDAPMRGAGLFLLLGAPTIFVLGSCFYAVAAHALQKAGRLQLKRWLALTSATPWILVMAFGAFAVVSTGLSWEGVLIGLLVGAAMSVFSLIGAFAWWLIAVPSVRTE